MTPFTGRLVSLGAKSARGDCMALPDPMGSQNGFPGRRGGPGALRGGKGGSSGREGGAGPSTELQHAPARKRLADHLIFPIASKARLLSVDLKESSTAPRSIVREISSVNKSGNRCVKDESDLKESSTASRSIVRECLHTMKVWGREGGRQGV